MSSFSTQHCLVGEGRAYTLIGVTKTEQETKFLKMC